MPAAAVPTNQISRTQSTRCQPSESVLTRRSLPPPPLLPPSAAAGDGRPSVPLTNTALWPMRYGLVAGLAASGCAEGGLVFIGLIGRPTTKPQVGLGLALVLGLGSKTKIRVRSTVVSAQFER